MSEVKLLSDRRPSRRDFVLGALEGLCMVGLLGATSCIPNVRERSKRKRTFLDVKRFLESRGYEILDEKVSDPQSSDYIVIVPEHHDVTNKYNAKTIGELARARLIERIDFENVYGSEGEDLLKRTLKEHEDVDLSRRLGEGTPVDVHYGKFMRQKFAVPSIGLDEPDIKRRAELAYSTEGHIVFNLYWEVGKHIRGELSLEEEKKYKEDLEKLRRNLHDLDLPFDGSRLKTNDSWMEYKREMVDELGKMILEDRNELFLTKIKARDAVIVGVAHSPGLMEGYGGNVIVVNPMNSASEESQTLRKKFSDLYKEKYKNN